MRGTADLLFSIGANTDDAEENIQRFRDLMSTDLSGLMEEWHHWEEEVFGDLNTVKGALTALTATMGAGLVAATGFLLESAKKYAEYVGEIERTAKATGISAENISVLGAVAKTSGTDMESLTHFLSYFERAVGQAAMGTGTAKQAFQALHITQAQLQKGQKDAIPLLELVAQRFRGLSAGVAQTTVAMELGGREGREMVAFLNVLGKEGLEKAAERARELGVEIGTKDVEAYEQNRVALVHLHEMFEGFEVTIGSRVLPRLNEILAWFVASPTVMMNSAGIMMDWAKLAASSVELAGKAVELSADIAERHINKLGADLFQAVEATSDLHDAYAKLAGDATNFGGAAAEAFAQAKREIASMASLVAGTGKTSGGLLDEEHLKKLKIDWIDLAEKGVHAYMEELKKVQEFQQHWQEEAASGIEKIDKDLAKQAEESISSAMALLPTFIDHIDFKAEDSYQKMALANQRFLDRVLKGNETAEDQLKRQYEDDLEAYSHAAEEKAAADGAAAGREAQVHQQFAQIREAIYQRYLQDLKNLQASDPWPKFLVEIDKNSKAWQNWANGAHGALAQVQLALQEFKQVGQEAWGELSNAMGRSIAQAILYKENIGKAMEQALKSTLVSLAGQALSYTIFDVGLGLMDLALGMDAKAALAFAAAEQMGIVAALTGGLGMAIPGGGSAGGAGSAQGRAGSASSSGMPGSAPLTQGPSVHVQIMGNLVGWSNIDELTQAINDAVLNRDVQLTATNTTSGVQVVR
jgi:hypothetical protein